MKKRDIIIAVIAVIVLVGLVFVFNSNELKKIGYKQYQKYDAENLEAHEIDTYIICCQRDKDYTQKGKQKKAKSRKKELYN